MSDYILGKRAMQAKIFMLTGWGRMATGRLASLKDAMEWCVKRRGRRYGIMVEDDPWALEYQRLYFWQQRISYAFGKSPVSGIKRWTERGFEQVDPRSDNRATMARYRERAHKAVHDPGWQKLKADLGAEMQNELEQERMQEYYSGLL